jgi:hypothetical protein
MRTSSGNLHKQILVKLYLMFVWSRTIIIGFVVCYRTCVLCVIIITVAKCALNNYTQLLMCYFPYIYIYTICVQKETYRTQITQLLHYIEFTHISISRNFMYLMVLWQLFRNNRVDNNILNISLDTQLNCHVTG